METHVDPCNMSKKHETNGFFPKASLMLGFWLFFQRIGERGNAVIAAQTAEYSAGESVGRMVEMCWKLEYLAARARGGG